MAFLRKSRGEGYAACIAEVWQSASPQGNLASRQLFGQIRTTYEFAQSTAFPSAYRKEYGLPRRSAPRNDMQSGFQPVQVRLSKAVSPFSRPLHPVTHPCTSYTQPRLWGKNPVDTISQAFYNREE